MLETMEDLANLLETDNFEIKYHIFYIPKRDGTLREIAAPSEELKRIQRIILEKILSCYSVHPKAQGFCSEKSILTNAQIHGNARIIINIDIKDFFPTITFPRILGVFRKKFPQNIAFLLACLCSLRGRLPQGACTSPALTNIICNNLDKRLNGFARSEDLIYTRYADDITFSSNREINFSRFFYYVTKIIKQEGFTLKREKTKILRKNRRQEITGLGINEGYPTISRKWLHKLRAIIHNKETKKRDIPERILKGMLSFVKMISQEKYERMRV